MFEIKITNFKKGPNEKKNKTKRETAANPQRGRISSKFVLPSSFVFLSNRAIRPLKTFTRCLDGRFFLRVFIKSTFFFYCSFNLWSDICIFTIYKRKIRRKKTERSVDTSILGRGLDGRESFTFNAQEMTSMSLSL